MAGDLVAECVHGVVQDVVKEATDLPLSLSLYPVFDGTAYATIPAWTPQSASGKMVVEFTTPTVLADEVLVGGATGPNERLQITVGGELRFNYQGEGATNPAALLPPGTLSPSTRYTAVVEFHSGGVTIRCAGQSGSHPTRISVQDMDFVRFASNGHATGLLFNGTIHSVQFLDHTPLQAARFMPGDKAVDRRAHLAPTAPQGAFELEADFVVPAVGGGQFIYAEHDGSNYGISIYLSGDFAADAGSAVLFGGTFTSVTGLKANQHYNLRIVYDGANAETFLDGVSVGTVTNPSKPAGIATANAARFYDSPLGGLEFQGTANLTIRDLETGQVWQYNNKNDSGNLLINSSPATAEGEELYSRASAYYTDGLGGNYTTFNSDGSARLVGGSAKLGINSGVTAGRTYAVTADVETVAGFCAVYNRDTSDTWLQTSGDYWGHPGSRKKQTFIFSATKSGEIGIASRGAGGEVVVHSLSIREVTHGLWHQSGEVMTDAAADAARTYLPRIDQRWIFTKPGEIYEQYSGQQATLVNLDESDWQKV